MKWDHVLSADADALKLFTRTTHHNLSHTAKKDGTDTE